ncbi:MAG TPA: T9SS type A sorting domain-containing protein, partial [Bacteroidia bacterium]|nr:T9SS type A sorting domain-containing protein [Bacteroidia bacterium]
INLNNNNTLTLAPNPANKFVSINFNSSISDNSTIRIYASQGKLFDTVQTEIKKGQNSVMLDVSKYPNGVYIILFNTSSNQYSTKLIVKHY